MPNLRTCLNARPIRLLAAFATLTTTVSAFAQSPIFYTGATYHESFDALPTAPAFTNLDGQWVNETTLTGWSRLINSDGTPGVENRWRVDNGNAAGGSLYSYGSFGSTDRAFGMVPSSNLVRIFIGVRIVNSTSQVLTGFDLDFVGEQWRRGNAAQSTMQFGYRIGTGPLNEGVWSTSASLNFYSPQFGGPEAGLDGNAPINKSARLGSIAGLNWAPGQSLMLRWSSENLPDPDHGLAVDDLNFHAVPEPATMVALGVGGLALIRRRRRN